MTRSAAALLTALAASAASAAVLRVGPGERFAKPSDAAAAARDGDQVVIAPGVYRGDVCAWTASRLRIRGAGPSATVVDAAGSACRGKGAWVVAGDGTEISGIGFRGARCRDRNGAGIRLEGAGLVVSNCLFTGNENGILTGARDGSRVTVTDCGFRGNGAGDGYSHNVYVGRVDALEFTRCRSDHALRGHALKSRARTTTVRDCVFDDGDDGESSYLADFPNGGRVTVSGCRFVQSPAAANGTMVSVGEEGAYPDSAFAESGNVYENRRGSGTKVRIAAGVTAAGGSGAGKN